MIWYGVYFIKFKLVVVSRGIRVEVCFFVGRWCLGRKDDFLGRGGFSGDRE